MIELKIEERAREKRAALLARADSHAAGNAATAISGNTVAALNALGVSMGTHLLAQCLIARASISVAAEWWSEIDGTPLPVAFQALLSIVVDLPPEIMAESYRVPDGER